MAGRLEGLVAIVTGGGGGLGRASAVEMAREGAKVVVNDIGADVSGEGHDSGRAQAVVDQIIGEGGEAIADTGDVTVWGDAEAMIQKGIDSWGKLDILVNVAGNQRLGTPVDTTQEDYDSVIRVHLRGFFNTTHFAALHWVERAEYGRLINFASGASLISQPTLLAYSTAKTGIVGFTRSCANSLVSYGVTANCVRPSAATAMMDLTFAAESRELMEESGQKISEISAGTYRDPAHVAPLVVFLASPAAGHITARFFEGKGGRYVRWSEPHEEVVLEENFLEDPDAVYTGLEEKLGAEISLADLPMPMPPLERLGEWKRDYGTRIPTWDGVPASSLR